MCKTKINIIGVKIELEKIIGFILKERKKNIKIKTHCVQRGGFGLWNKFDEILY